MKCLLSFINYIWNGMKGTMIVYSWSDTLLLCLSISFKNWLRHFESCLSQRVAAGTLCCLSSSWIKVWAGGDPLPSACLTAAPLNSRCSADDTYFHYSRTFGLLIFQVFGGLTPGHKCGRTVSDRGRSCCGPSEREREKERVSLYVLGL